MTPSVVDGGQSADAPKFLRDLTPKADAVRVLPMGGLGEIGANCCVFEHAGAYIMIDCGQMMPDEDMLGIDSVIPDLSFLEARKDKLTAIVLTHAHEDHIGALPFVLPKFPGVPLYATKLTRALVTEKLKEHGISPNWRDMVPRRPTVVSPEFTVEAISVTHSMMDTVAIALRTPAGVVIHSGDFKIDPHPPDGVAFDHYAFARYAEESEEGVLLLMSDSTNVDRSGSCPSETEVIPGIEKILRETTTAVIISTFASSLHRIQTILNLAADCDRTVVAVGLNMERNIRIASKLGMIDIPCKYTDSAREAAKIPRNKRLILCTGSQGEPQSSLTRIALGTHKDIKIEEGDVVVMSARLIPGNESAIYRMINHLSRRGAQVITESMARVHVSGHGYRDDMKHLINLTNPRFFVPLHGEFRHLRDHCRLAVAQGLEEDEAFLLENGDCLEVSHKGARVLGRVPHGRLLVDGKGIGDVDEAVLRDRRFLAEDGMLVVVLTIDHETGEVLGDPEIVSRGFVVGPGGEGRLKEVVVAAYEELSDETRTESHEVQAAIKKAARQHIKKESERFPVIMSVVLEV